MDKASDNEGHEGAYVVKRRQRGVSSSTDDTDGQTSDPHGPHKDEAPSDQANFGLAHVDEEQAQGDLVKTRAGSLKVTPQSSSPIRSNRGKAYAEVAKLLEGISLCAIPAAPAAFPVNCRAGD